MQNEIHAGKTKFDAVLVIMGEIFAHVDNSTHGQCWADNSPETQ